MSQLDVQTNELAALIQLTVHKILHSFNPQNSGTPTKKELTEVLMRLNVLVDAWPEDQSAVPDGETGQVIDITKKMN